MAERYRVSSGTPGRREVPVTMGVPASFRVAGQPSLAGADVYVRGLDGRIYEKVLGSTGRFVAPY